jgi:hypothetical protein
MNRAQAKRTWTAARDNGCKALSWRLYDTLLAAARPHGCHEATNGGACYELARKDLVTVAYPYATATEAGRALLAKIASAASGRTAPTIGACSRCGSVLSAVTQTCVRGDFCPGRVNPSSTSNV